MAELLDLLSRTVEDELGGEVWIRGEIRNRKRSRKDHVYFDLVTPAPAGQNPKESLPVVLFDWYRRIVNRILGPEAAGHMTDGVEVRVRGQVSVYKPRGQLQLRMTAIDPTYTLSRLADERDRLLAELSAAGLLERNRSLPLRVLPLRVGLVTSANSAAAADFRELLSASAIGWEVQVADTPVQGSGSPARIAEALALADRQDVDVIALVRGGGSRTELAPFDSEPVARAIAERSVPVLTGIGHEIDRSVADVVAHTSCHTPTACAAALVAHVDRFDQASLAMWRHLERIVAARIDGDRRRLAAAAGQTGAAVSVGCRHARHDIARLTLDLGRAARHGAARANWHLDGQAAQAADRAAARLGEHRGVLAAVAARLRLDTAHALAAGAQQLQTIAAQLRASDPQRALERGWSITSDDAGHPIRSVRGITPGATLHTRMRDGSVTSTVVAVSPAETTGNSHD